MFPLKQTRSVFFCSILPLALCLGAARTVSDTASVEGTDAAPMAASPSHAPVAISEACPDTETDSDDFVHLMNGPMAGSDTDQFTWQVLAIITRPAAKQRTIIRAADHSVVMSNDEEWETWADDIDLFRPHPDAKRNKPCWNTPREGTGLKLTGGPLKSRLAVPAKVVPASVASAAHVRAQRHFRPSATPISNCANGEGQCEEVRHNRQDFESIVDNGMWYVQGLKAEAAQPLNGYVPTGQAMRKESIEIKAQWAAISDAQKANYHWNYDAQGNLYGLIALHLITKALPNWTWATFEWKGNPGRCDNYGCNDPFGGEVIQAGSQPDPNQILSPAVQKLPWKGNVFSEWSNYRLKGTQTDFCVDKSYTCDEAHATTLGSSILEKNVVPGRASCIACHALASVKADGSNAIGRFTNAIKPSDPSVPGTQSSGFLGVPCFPSDTHPIGFIWSVTNAFCDSTDSAHHPCPDPSMPSTTPQWVKPVFNTTSGSAGGAGLK